MTCANELDMASSAPFGKTVRSESPRERWHGLRFWDDAMIRRSRTSMTIFQLKRSVDGRFRRLQRSMDGRLRRLGRSMDARFERLERSMRSMRSEITGSALENGRLAEETRRHFDVVAESLRDEIRLIAEAVGRARGPEAQSLKPKA